MTNSNHHGIQQQLKDTLDLLKSVLGPDLLGVYLYGSSLVGGLQRYSDIDFFVVTQRTISLEEKTRLVTNCLRISGLYMHKGPKRPIELTCVEQTAVNPWRYPPHFDFQYGEWLRHDFENGSVDPWTTREMPDLALIITHVLLKSQTLWGAGPEQVLAPVPYHDYMKALLHDLDRLATDLESDTRNVLLAYARTWSTLETHTIRSKPAAAEWALNRFPPFYQPVMARAKLICIGEEHEQWDDLKTFIKPCADFIADKIKARISLVDFNDATTRIELAKDSPQEIYLL